MSAKLRRAEGGIVTFWCPGCEEAHAVPVAGGGILWSWNGSMDRPTFGPSILCRSGHFAPGHSGSCWCTYNAEHPQTPAPFKCGICHSFVADGRIQFLTDSTHRLAGQTVDLPDDWATDATPA